MHFEDKAAVWQVLDTNSIWVKEFASALNVLTPTVGWSPQSRITGGLQNWEREILLTDPVLHVKCFPVQRGYRHPTIAWLSRTTKRCLERLSRLCPDSHSSTLICTSPFYAGIAEQWSGPVIYYVTDLTAGYDKVDPAQVRELDERMCRTVTMVCPNSERIGQYLRRAARCSTKKITVVPNATRSNNVFRDLPRGTAAPPSDIAGLPRPIAGVIGNLAANMDWDLLQMVIDATPAFSWVFVGPVNMPIAEQQQRKARRDLTARGGRVQFTGAKPYSSLCDYARAFDVAVLPYRKQEPTYSGSATRFYDHLAACRPMIGTTGQAELLEKQPLLQLAASAEEMICQLEGLRSAGFEDGNELLRWRASFNETWNARAVTMKRGLASALDMVCCGDSDAQNFTIAESK